VGGRGEVLLDGGVRRGTDVLKAKALGATAVMVGRPALYGVSAGGEEGVVRMLELLKDEISRALMLCGVADIRAIDRDILATDPPAHGVGIART
jgi:isopentenyl diphosphate isomerase/L-lactate dehydrogenase-like FMN-dependent dehydrogenase